MFPYYIKKSDFPKIVKQRQIFQSILLVILSGLPLFYLKMISKVTTLAADFGARLPFYYPYLPFLLPLLSVLTLGMAFKLYSDKPLETKQTKRKLSKYKQSEMVDYHQVMPWKNNLGFVVIALVIFAAVVTGMFGVILPIYTLSSQL
jgi:hypothetical protein